jgi:hypothetical protein
MSTYLKDSTNFHKRSFLYIWKEKIEFSRGDLFYLEENEFPDSLLIWDNLSLSVVKDKKMKCKLDKDLPHKFTKSEKVWSVFSGIRAKKGNWLAVFSEILYYRQKQALCFVKLYRYIYNDSFKYLFLFEKEKEKWVIKKVAVVFFS